MRGLFSSIAWIFLSVAFAGSACAAREFPSDAQRGDFTVLQFPVVKLGRHTMRLAPGAQIRNEANQIVMPTSLSGEFPVLFTMDHSGEVFRVWLLTPEEAKQFKAPWRWPWPW